MHRKLQVKQTATPGSSQQNEKHPNEGQQRLPQTVVALEGLLGKIYVRFVRQDN